MQRFVLLLSAVFVAAMLPSCTQPENPGKPDKPENPENPENPNKPEDPTPDYFKLTTEAGGEVPGILVFDYMGGGTIYNLKVDTNMEGWTVECNAPEWCTVTTENTMIRFGLQVYQEANSQSPPRRCQVRIKAKDVFDRTLTLGQESMSQFLYTLPNYQFEFDLPASGAPIEVTVVSNLVEWVVDNKTDWIKAEKVDAITLRVSSIPSETEHGRTGGLQLVSIANDYQANPGNYWDLYFHEELPGVSGEDYSYGKGYQWN